MGVPVMRALVLGPREFLEPPKQLLFGFVSVVWLGYYGTRELQEKVQEEVILPSEIYEQVMTSF